MAACLKALASQPTALPQRSRPWPLRLRPWPWRLRPWVEGWGRGLENWVPCLEGWGPGLKVQALKVESLALNVEALGWRFRPWPWRLRPWVEGWGLEGWGPGLKVQAVALKVQALGWRFRPWRLKPWPYAFGLDYITDRHQHECWNRPLCWPSVTSQAVRQQATNTNADRFTFMFGTLIKTALADKNRQNNTVRKIDVDHIQQIWSGKAHVQTPSEDTRRVVTIK